MDKHFNNILLKKLIAIKDGEFPRLFKHGEGRFHKGTVSIPKEQILKFEELKQKQRKDKSGPHVQEATPWLNAVSVKKHMHDIDRILLNRDLHRKKKHYLREGDHSEHTPTMYDPPNIPVGDKMNEEKLKAWVDNCYETIHNSGTNTVSKELNQLVKANTKLDHFEASNELLRSESLVNFEDDMSDLDELSSIGSEAVLRQKASPAGASFINATSGDKEKAEGKENPKKYVVAREGVNFVLEDYYIRDSKELKSLAYDEELYVFNKKNGAIVGSWKTSANVCEDRDDCLTIHFEGLIDDPDHSCTYVMNMNGLVDQTYTPITELRMEQEIEKGESRSKIVFLQKKQSKWLFDVREASDSSETSKSFSATYPQMQRVLTESASLLLIRKVIVFRYPAEFEEPYDDLECMPCGKPCACTGVTGGCGCQYNLPLKIRKKFRLQMRAITIAGDLVRCNYRFYAPVRVNFNKVDLKVVRVRRRMEMPGDLVQTSNYYITTAGQLMAVTFNDPYPYDTNFYLQIDPKSVLDPCRVLSPERIVPLRERYMCDPQLRQFYEDEVQRFISLNQTYLSKEIRVTNTLKSIFRNLLNDKPHRVEPYIKGFELSQIHIVDPCDETQNRKTANINKK